MYLGNELPFTIMSPIWKTSFLKNFGRFREYFLRFQDPEFYSRIFCLGYPKYKYFDETEDSYYRKSTEKKLGASEVQKGYLHFFRNWSTEVYLLKIEDRILAKNQLKKFSNRLIKDYFIYYCNNNYKLAWLTLKIGWRGKLYSRFQYKLIIIYLLGCKYEIYKIKGFGWLAKKLIFW
jgi:hypothetical protein